MPTQRPTIKGAYVLSHIKAFAAEHGEEKLIELQRRYGKSLLFSGGDHVSVAEEVTILEHIVEMNSPKRLSSEERALYAGHLHFTNFTSTPLWTILNPLVRRNMHMVLMQ